MDGKATLSTVMAALAGTDSGLLLLAREAYV
jgi:hypothetical protein